MLVGAPSCINMAVPRQFLCFSDGIWKISEHGCISKTIYRACYSLCSLERSIAQAWLYPPYRNILVKVTEFIGKREGFQWVRFGLLIIFTFTDTCVCNTIEIEISQLTSQNLPRARNIYRYPCKEHKSKRFSSFESKQFVRMGYIGNMLEHYSRSRLFQLLK